MTKLELKIPSMGESISEATIGQIFTPNGMLVNTDDEILELETDKVNQVLYAPGGGKVNLSVKTGDTVKIGQTIGSIESISPAEAQVKTPAKKEAVQATVKSPPIQKEESLRYGKEAFLSDLKKPLPKESPAPKELPPPPQKQTGERETRRPMTKIRKVIAQRLVEAQQTTAMLTTFNEVDLTQVIFLREKYKEAFAKKFGCKLGFMSFFVKATVSALQAFPDINSYISGEEIVHREYYNIGVAVGTERGVIVPVIRDCDRLSFAEIELTLENFAKKAREGTISVNDLQGGGFTITNGGVYGSLLSTPILLPPQSGILGMHKIEKRPVVISDQVTIRSMMYLALSYDHRLIDGKEAVTFLIHIKNVLEDPSRFLLEV